MNKNIRRFYMEIQRKQIILGIDFDNTIADVTHFPKINGLRKGANKYITKLFLEGYYIIINTCRTDVSAEHAHESDAKDFLLKNNVPFHLCNENHKELCNIFKTDSRKISADIYVDDKGLWLFGIPNWFWLYWMIKIKSKFLKNPLLKYKKEEIFA